MAVSVTKQLTKTILFSIKLNPTQCKLDAPILLTTGKKPFAHQNQMSFFKRLFSTRFGVQEASADTDDEEMTRPKEKDVKSATGGGDGSPQNKSVVCIEGNIGSGKTTLLDYFKSFPGCEVWAEPVDKWRDIRGHNPLALMYQDPVRWSMSLQTYIQLTMLQIHTRPQTQPVRLMERSIYSAKYCFTDNLYKSGRMAEVDHLILTEWFNWIMKTQNVKVDLIVYLRTDPEVLYSRIQQRCRHEEERIPLDYLQTLHQLYEDWLIEKKIPCPAEVLIIDGNPSKEDMLEIYESHRAKILLQN